MTVSSKEFGLSRSGGRRRIILEVKGCSTWQPNIHNNSVQSVRQIPFLGIATMIATFEKV